MSELALKQPPRYRPAPCPQSCKHPNVGGDDWNHSHDDDFTRYWDALSGPERDWLRDRSRRYQQTLMASARSGYEPAQEGRQE